MKFFIVLTLPFLVSTEGGMYEVARESQLMTTGFKDDGVLASVREFPLFLHKCTAAFLTPLALLTTASCLTCADSCNYYIRIHSRHLLNTINSTGMTYPVYRTVMHPDYEKHPRFNDVGIIMLQHPAKDPYICSLPRSGFHPMDNTANIFSWQFNKDLSDYTLLNRSAKAISNKVCSSYLHRFVQYQEICTVVDQPFSLGPFDHGSPIIAPLDGRNVILGTFVETGFVRDERVMVYQSITPHIGWIWSVVGLKDPSTTPLPPSTMGPDNGHHVTPSYPNNGHYMPPSTPNGGHRMPPPTPNGGHYMSSSTPDGGHYVPSTPAARYYFSQSMYS